MTAPHTFSEKLRELAAMTALLAGCRDFTDSEKEIAIEARAKSLGLPVDGPLGAILAGLVLSEVRRLPLDMRKLGRIARCPTHRLQ